MILSLNHKLLISGVALVLLLRLTRGKFGKIVPNQKLRACDPQGCGAYGVSRDGGSRSHNGIDIVVSDGQAIKSPITGIVARMAYPYASDLSWHGIVIENDIYYIKMYYLEPSVTKGTSVKRGEVIGYAQNIADKYNNITPHVHLEAYIKDSNGDLILIDPTGLF